MQIRTEATCGIERYVLSAPALLMHVIQAKVCKQVGVVAAAVACTYLHISVVHYMAEKKFACCDN